MKDLKDFFENPSTARQKQYEVLRGYIKEGYTITELEQKFGYKRNTIYSLIRDLRAGKLELFPNIKPGPKRSRISSETKKKILRMRFGGMSTSQIKRELNASGEIISVKTVERVLYETGLAKVRSKPKNNRNSTK